MDLQRFQTFRDRVLDEVCSVIVGKRQVAELVLTCFVCRGHVLLEEHSPHGIGNHAVILTDCDEELELKFRDLLESLHFTGFSNFDIKYDRRDGKYKAFEINCRQGRSNYYVTATGMNIARLVVEKWNDGGTDCVLNKNEVFWHHVPAQVAFHLHRGQGPRRPRQGAESAGQGGVQSAVQARPAVEPRALCLRAGAAEKAVQEV